MRKIIRAAFLLSVVLAFAPDAKGQSQIGNPTNAFWDGTTLPMKEVEPAVYAIYSGDINQDGTIDGADANLLEIDANNFAFGYNPTDLNGDGASDGADANILEINANLFLFVARPQ